MDITFKKCFKVGISAFLLFLCIYYWSAVSKLAATLVGTLSPIFLGIAAAYVLNILMSFYEAHYFTEKLRNKKFIKATRRPVCIIAAILTLVGLIVLITILVIPELMSCMKFIIDEIPPAINKLLSNQWVKEIVPKEILSELNKFDWNSYITKLINTVSAGLNMAINAVVSVVSSIVSVVVTVTIGLIFSIYLLFGKERLQSQSKRLIHRFLKPSWEKALLHAMSVLNDCFRKYIIGQCIEAVIIGLLCTLGMFIFRFPYAGMIGALVGFTALIPVAGAYIGAIVGSVMILTQSPVKALLFLVFIIILQQIEGNLIYPKVVGSSLGLPAIWVLLAVTVGGGLMGVLGMIISVPVMAAIYRLAKEDIENWEIKANEKAYGNN